MNPLVTMSVTDESQSKANYLMWRQKWRINYAACSAAIRHLRVAYRTAQRRGVWEESMLVLGALEGNQRIARRMMREHVHGKKLVREFLRSKGLSAPDPMKRPKPEPPKKNKLTAEEIKILRDSAVEKRQQRHKRALASGDAHSD